ncbi:MAG: folylpolyglutamate synthase/dihydrofolate synthase family protein [Rikenellaceae bacterium]
MNYQQTCDYLFSAMPSFQQVGGVVGDSYKPGLDRIESFCEYLGSPHHDYITIHIAGTNGKGSTSSMLAAVLRSAGYRVGLFTSPHLRDFRERVKVDGVMISQSEVVDFVAEHRATMEALGLSFFEMTAALAFSHFSHQDVDVAVIECGLGGRLDATNIVDPALSIITNIGIDHVQYLGDTLPKIAAEKAGIIKRGRGVILGERDDEYNDVIAGVAEQMGAEMIFAQDHYHFVESRGGVITVDGDERLTLTLDLMGEYQHKNIITLLTAIDYLNSSRYPIEVSEAELRDGLRSVVKLTSLQGRWQTLQHNPLMICDTGHNKSGVECVVNQLNSLDCDRIICVLGFANDKDVESILALFTQLPEDTKFIFTRAQCGRAMEINRVVDSAKRVAMNYDSAPSVNEAVTLAKSIAQPSDVIFIGGSTFIVADLF